MRNYGMKRALLGAAIAALAMNAPAAHAATATGTATAKILRQITLTKTSDLQYATIISGATASTVAVPVAVAACVAEAFMARAAIAAPRKARFIP